MMGSWRGRAGRVAAVPDFRKQHISTYVHILVYDECTDITKDILNTPAGKFEGGTKISGRTRVLCIVWDSRVMEESLARPSVRMPPLQIMESAPAVRAHPLATQPTQQYDEGTTPIGHLHQLVRGPRIECPVPAVVSHHGPSSTHDPERARVLGHFECAESLREGPGHSFQPQ